MTNKNPKTDWKKGNVCFFHDVLSNEIQMGVIESFSKDRKWARVRQPHDMNAILRALSCLFATRTDAERALSE